MSSRLAIDMIWVGMIMLAVITPLALAGGLSLPNPSFEENVAADGVPDGWKIGNGAAVSLSTHASDGAKAAKFTDGYVLLEIDQKLDRLAGRRLTLAMDIAGEDGAELGAMVGYVEKAPDGSSKFGHHRLTWGRKLTKEYKPLALPLVFPANAVDGRVWVGIYRSNKTGTVYLDNFRSTDEAMSNDEQAKIRRMQREWDYLLERAQNASGQLPAKSSQSEIDGIVQQATAVRDRCLRLDSKLIEEAAALDEQRTRLGARIYQLQAPDQPFAVGLSLAAQRLDPAETLPAKPEQSMQLLSLANEHQALGVTIWNCREQAAAMRLDITGLETAAESVTVRQQVFLENYYDKEKVRVADALTQLAKSGSAWEVSVPGGQAVKLYIEFKTAADMAGSNPVQINVSNDGGQTRVLNAVVEVLPAALPDQPRLRHKQFMYPQLAPATNHPEQAAQDLADHHVTAIEFPFTPPAVFNADGSLAETKFEGSPQDRWMRAYGPKIDHLVLFWEGSMLQGLPTAGDKLPSQAEDKSWTPQAERAFRELLRAWLDYAAKNGFGLEHWAIMPGDEVASAEEWATPPGPKVRRMMQLCQAVREVEPKLPIYATFGIYSLPEDVKAVGPWLDVAVPYYPYPEKLARWSPPEYNPQSAFATTTFPYLQELRDNRDTEIISYHVSRGKKDLVLSEVMAYPVEAVAHGFTGIGFWAYNVTRGLSWDDSDGGLLDYSFIYDGTESHPLNRLYNVTNEVVVPSIRWQALRLGWQDGQILLSLKDRRDQKRLTADQAGKVDAALAEVKAFAERPELLTDASYARFADGLRRLYVSASREKGTMP